MGNFYFYTLHCFKQPYLSLKIRKCSQNSWLLENIFPVLMINTVIGMKDFYVQIYYLRYVFEKMKVLGWLTNFGCFSWLT